MLLIILHICPSHHCIIYVATSSSLLGNFTSFTDEYPLLLSSTSPPPPPSLPSPQVSGPGDFTLLVDPNDDNGTAYIAYGGHPHHIISCHSL